MPTDWSKYLANGVSIPPGGKVPLRQDIRDLSPEQKYLYFEGLKSFQDNVKNDPENDPLSYFQIAGIHGRPYEEWPNKNGGEIPEKPDIPGDGFKGFCTHSSVLFLTWHRPYLALFESTLHNHVKAIANGIADNDPEKQEYLTLAEDFRIPYWDWARPDTQIVPEEALKKTYDARWFPPSVPFKDNYNPLFAYKFPEGTKDNITLGQETTFRYLSQQSPRDNILDKMKRFYKSPPALSSLPVLNAERNLTERTAYILKSYDTYVALSNNKLRADQNGQRIQDATNWGSLEDIHNAIHNLVGGGGHMSGIEVSAFDPIFWLHHANIDRLFAIWQALHENDSNPNTFVLPRQADGGKFGGTFSTKKLGEETIESKLYPFRSDETSWYDSSLTKRTESFGYSYPETTGLKYPTSPSDKAGLIKRIRDTYETLPEIIRKSKKKDTNAGEDLLPQAQVLKEIKDNNIPATTAELQNVVENLPDAEKLLKASWEPSKPILEDLAPNYKYLEWMTNIKAQKHTLDGAYTVHVFLGPVDEENVALWPAAPTHVGTFAPLGQASETGCDKCQQDQRDHTEVTSQIPLTIALVERYLAQQVQGLSEETVVPYLKKNLRWRVAKADGSVLENRQDVEGLTVLVVSNEVTIPEDDTKLPIYAPDVKIYPEITAGRGDGTGYTGGDL